MKPEERLSHIKELSDLPSTEELTQLARGITWKFVFGEAVADVRKEIGARWKHSLPNFSVGVHTSAPIIQCLKLITDEEIHTHQDFWKK